MAPSSGADNGFCLQGEASEQLLCTHHRELCLLPMSWFFPKPLSWFIFPVKHFKYFVNIFHTEPIVFLHENRDILLHNCNNRAIPERSQDFQYQNTRKFKFPSVVPRMSFAAMAVLFLLFYTGSSHSSCITSGVVGFSFILLGLP